MAYQNWHYSLLKEIPHLKSKWVLLQLMETIQLPEKMETKHQKHAENQTFKFAHGLSL